MPGGVGEVRGFEAEDGAGGLPPVGRVCVPGSVEVPALLRTEAHPRVWHLVSDVRGIIQAGTGTGS